MPSARTIYEQPEAWEHLQQWFERNDDPLRPWNVSAISRQVHMPQAVVRSLLTAPKGSSPGLSRVAFTVARLRVFQCLFRRYGYRTQLPEQLNPTMGHCRAVPILTGVQLHPYAYA